MAEWLKARASKACIPLRVSGVRIPLSPPLRNVGLEGWILGAAEYFSREF